jgi:hypothetical protein
VSACKKKGDREVVFLCLGKDKSNFGMLVLGSNGLSWLDKDAADFAKSA